MMLFHQWIRCLLGMCLLMLNRKTSLAQQPTTQGLNQPKNLLGLARDHGSNPTSDGASRPVRNSHPLDLTDETDPCNLYSFTSCDVCLTRNGCSWCPTDGFCTSDTNSTGLSCSLDDYFDSCQEEDNFFRYVDSIIRKSTSL